MDDELPALNLQSIHRKILAAGTVGWGRITETKYSDSLGFGKRDTRFSDPRNIAAADKFGVIYFGENFETCFTETLIRDELVFSPKITMPLVQAYTKIYVPIEIRRDLLLLDLTHGKFLPLHIHSDTLRGRDQKKARKLALRIFLNHPEFEGILYESRFTSDKNIALFDRGVSKITAGQPISLMDHLDFPEAQDKYLFELSL